MIEISSKLEQYIMKIMPDKIGHFSEFGAVIGDSEFVLVYEGYNIYLAHISEFEQDGILVRLKEKK
jgi:hypothetical protein